MTARVEVDISRQECFVLDGILWVPHYKREGVFVGPGHHEFDAMPVNPRYRPVERSREQLVAAGAVTTYEALWRRARGVEEEPA